MLYALSLTVDTILLLVFAALFIGFVLVLWLSVRRSGKHSPETAADTAEESESGRHDARDEARDGARDADGDETLDETLDEDGDGMDGDGWTPPEPEAFPARVVDMRVVSGNVGGSKRPKTGVSFLVTFLTDDGARAEYPVPEELYVTLEVDQTGTLVILNGGFFDFGAGDEYDPAAAEAFEETFGTAEETE